MRSVDDNEIAIVSGGLSSTDFGWSVVYDRNLDDSTFYTKPMCRPTDTPEDELVIIARRIKIINDEAALSLTRCVAGITDGKSWNNAADCVKGGVVPLIRD